MNPLISVIIPVYNEEKRIARTLQSMQSQTYKNLEIIVVDDGSTDTTYRIVESLAKVDSRIKLYRAPLNKESRTNWRGYDISAGYAARNFGFLQAHGEWITTQDADDASLLNRIEVQYNMAIKYTAKLVTIQWLRLTPESLTQKLDIEKMFADKGEDALIIRPETIFAQARANKGILMQEWFHRYIPFPIKWFPYTRKLFYRSTESYPGADNSMLFHRSVIDDGILFRHRNKRTWGTPSGRGSGRDFAYRVAYLYKNSWSFKLPMYLWDVKSQNTEYADDIKYLIS